MSLTANDRFAAATAVANATLYEGYVLYPHHASAATKQLRWQFGVLVPPAQAAENPSERSWSRTAVVVEPGSVPMLHVRVRCLHAQRLTLEGARHDGGFDPIAQLRVGTEMWSAWDEAVEETIDLGPIALRPLGGPVTVRVALAERDEVEELRDEHADLIGRARRRREPVKGDVMVTWERPPGPGGRLVVRVTVGNTTSWSRAGARRDEVVRRSLVGVHTLLAVDDARFLSAVEPPAHAATAVAACNSEGTWPVLVDASDTVMLSSPIILRDHPAATPENPGAPF